MGIVSQKVTKKIYHIIVSTARHVSGLGYVQTDDQHLKEMQWLRINKVIISRADIQV